MNNITVAVASNGELQYTLQEQHFSTDFIIGHRSIKRMTEILFSENHQKFYIRLLEPKLIAFNHNTDTIYDKNTKEYALFPTYKAAVDYEIIFVDNYRKLGGSI